MKIPPIKVYYTETYKPTMHIRYGKNWSGDYFFQVVSRHPGNGIGFSFCTSLHDKAKWEKYIKYLNTLPIDKRLKKVRFIIKRIERYIKTHNLKQGTTFKFKTSTLFKAYEKN